MAINTRGSIDPRWPYHSRNVGRALELAEVEIFSGSNADRVYDPVTNAWTGDATTLFTGRARIQQKNTSSDTSTSYIYNPTMLQNVDVFISYGRNTLAGSDGDIPDIRPNDKMRVTSADYNPDLTKFLFTVIGVMNSSNSWEKRLLCRIDTEIDPTETA